ARSHSQIAQTQKHNIGTSGMSVVAETKNAGEKTTRIVARTGELQSRFADRNVPATAPSAKPNTVACITASDHTPHSFTTAANRYASVGGFLLTSASRIGKPYQLTSVSSGRGFPSAISRAV